LNPKIAELEDGVAESVTHRAGQQGSGGRAPEARAPAARPQPLPAHLPRKRVVIEPPAAACSSCGCTVLRKIGKVVTELLEYLPSSFKVIQHVRPTMSCRTCKTRLQVPLPSLPIEGGRPGAALPSACTHYSTLDGALAGVIGRTPEPNTYSASRSYSASHPKWITS